MEKEMYVGIDQTRHEGCVAEVDGLHPGGVSYGGAGGNNFSALNQDLTGSENTACFYIEQARGMENDGLRRGQSLRRRNAG
jgi:hypothetical protein